jgi:ubiquinone/menaquinone biosynthesis C-methylase UbiE
MNIENVKSFWNSNPLFQGESRFESGTKDFFAEHEKVALEDCFAGAMDEKIFNNTVKDSLVLDVGCGIGFWIIEFSKRGYKHITACDLTEKAVEIAKKRCEVYGVEAKITVGNAEKLEFEDGSMDHINCQGVIHHTPNTEACIREFTRVLRDGGTASISVYYKNIFLRSWPLFKWLSHLLHLLGFKLIGRGRENIFAAKDASEIVRLYDGSNNPIGKYYSQKQLRELVDPYFEVKDIYFHFFPARSLPIKIPQTLHKVFDRYLPFMIYANLQKKKH